MLNEEQRKKMLNDSKMLLGLKDDSQDGLLSFLIDDTVDAILGYCQIESLPAKLESLIPVILTDRYRCEGYGSTDLPIDIKSEAQGDRSASYEVNRPSSDYLNNYLQRIKSFVSRKGRVPSDVISV